MFELPREGILGQGIALARFASKQHVSTHAAHASYFIVLAVFPSLLLLLGLLRYTGLEVESLLQVLQEGIPEALMPILQQLIYSAYYSTSGAVVSVSAVTALWSASRGVFGLLSGLNAIYGVRENRGYFYTRTVSVLYTFGLLVVLQLTLLFHVFGTAILEAAPNREGFWYYLAELIHLRFFILFGLQTVLFTAIFMVLPNRKNSFMDSLPGALLSSVGWLVFSDLYSIYVESFVGYANVYGSVYAVALSMLWLYCCISIVFYGGVLNRWIMDQE